VIGREREDSSYVGIDFLLPVLPWISDAIERAQANQLDYPRFRSRIVARRTRWLIILTFFDEIGTEP